MRLAQRLERLEARMPKPRRRTILVWVDKTGRRTKAADSDPDMPDPNTYDAYVVPFHSSEGGSARDADPKTD